MKNAAWTKPNLSIIPQFFLFFRIILTKAGTKQWISFFLYLSSVANKISRAFRVYTITFRNNRQEHRGLHLMELMLILRTSFSCYKTFNLGMYEHLIMN
jgi:hypothetical protein